VLSCFDEVLKDTVALVAVSFFYGLDRNQLSNYFEIVITSIAAG